MGCNGLQWLMCLEGVVMGVNVFVLGKTLFAMGCNGL